MRSIKPGRGPSAMNVVGGVIGIVFGIFWTILAFSITRGAPGPIGLIFPLFGLLFVGAGIANLVYNVHNTVAKNRFSTFDVTTHGEEPDPLNQRFGAPPAARGAQPAPPADGVTAARPARKHPGDFCPFCGGKVSDEFDYCPKCGKDI